MKYLHPRSIVCIALVGLSWMGSVQAVSLIDELARVVPTHPQVVAAQAQLDALTAEIDLAQAPSNVRGGLEGGPSYSKNISGGTGYNNANLGAKVIVPLYDGGRVTADTERAQQKVLAQQARILEAQREVANKLSAAYVDVVKRQALLVDAQAHYKQLEEIAQRMQRIMAVDPGRSADYSQALSRTAQQEQTIAQRRAELADVQGVYISLSSTVLIQGQEPHDYPVKASDAQFVKEWVERSPSVQATVAELSAGAATLALANAWERPTISMVGRLDSRRDTLNKVHYFDSASLGLNVAWDRFDGGAGAATAKAALNRYKAGQSQLDGVRRETEGQILRVLTYANGLEGRPEAGIKAELCAHQVRVAYRKQFDVARRPLIDLLNAENDWFSQRSSAISAHYESIAARLRVGSAAGDLWPINASKLQTTKGMDQSKVKDAVCLSLPTN